MYFINRGIAYGFGLGALTGTIVLFPILGTILGALFGSLIGCAVGLGVALVLVPTFLLTYRPRRISLRRYSRQFARCAAVLVTLIALTLLWYSTNLNWESGWKLLISATIVVAGLWAVLAAAYTAHQYPYYVANQRNPRIAVPTDDQPPPLFSVMIGSVTDYASLAWLLGLAVLGGTALHVSFQGAEAFQDIERFVLGVLVAALSLWISPIYTLPANTILLRFLRRLIFDDYLPHLSSQTRRVTETIIVFIATCGFIWWVGFVPFGVPILGLYSARLHYLWSFFEREEELSASGGEELSSTF